METETNTREFTIEDATRLQVDVQALLEKYSAAEIDDLPEAQRAAVLEHLQALDEDMYRFRTLLEATQGHHDNSTVELIERYVAAAVAHAQAAAANMATQADAARLGRALHAAGMAPPKPAPESAEEISGIEPADDHQPPAPSSAAPTAGAAPGVMDTLRQLTSRSTQTVSQPRLNATPDNRAVAANGLRRRPDQMPDPLESRLISLLGAKEALAKAQQALRSCGDAQAQMSTRDEAVRAVITNMLPGSPGRAEYARRVRHLDKAQHKVERRAEAVLKLQQTRPDLFAPANLDKNSFHYNAALGQPAGGAAQIRDKLLTVATDGIADPEIDNLVGIDGTKLGGANKLFEERMQGLGKQLSSAIERIWDTVAARLSQATTKSSDMDQQPGMGPG